MVTTARLVKNNLVIYQLDDKNSIATVIGKKKAFKAAVHYVKLQYQDGTILELPFSSNKKWKLVTA